MSFNLNKWLEETIEIDSGLLSLGIVHQKIRPRIICQDGFSVSVQASENHYCNPRYTQYKNDDIWHVINADLFESDEHLRKFDTDHYIPYDSVELGFPSESDELIIDYAEEDDDYTNTVYGHVPVSIVEQLIDKHGGFKEVKV